MKHLVILNAKAGEGQASEHLESIREAFKDVECEFHTTEAPREATKFIDSYLNEHKKDSVRVYACGGDGTVHEVVNGLIGHDNAELAIYPIGTGNDFAKYYGIERFLDLKALQKEKATPIDLTKISGGNLDAPLYSINVINFGFDAIVGAVGNKNKEKGKKDPYGKALKVAIFKGRFNHIKVSGDGEPLNKKSMLLCTIAQGGYVGGKFYCAPHSKNDDGLLDVCLLKTRPLLSFLKILNPYTEGKHLDEPKFRKTLVYKQCKTVTIDAPKMIDVCVDGEMILGQHFDVEVVPGAVKLVVPQK